MSLWSDRFKAVIAECVFGSIICLGTWLIFFSVISQVSTSWLGLLLWCSPLITGVLGIVGVIIAQRGRAKGFILCITVGLGDLLLVIFSGFMFLLGTLSVLFLIGPLLIMIGGVQGYKELK